LNSQIEAAQKNGLADVHLHLFTDGKDSGQKEAPALIEKLNTELKRIGIGHIVSIVGRNFAMDRDTNWDKTKVAYDLWTQGTGEVITDPIAAIQEKYTQG